MAAQNAMETFLLAKRWLSVIKGGFRFSERLYSCDINQEGTDKGKK